MSLLVKESYFWTQVKGGLTDLTTHMCRIENTAGTGIFDVNACSSGVEVWVELKVFHGNILKFRTSQRVWAAVRTVAGAKNLFVLARKDDWSGGTVMYLYRAEEVFKVPSKVSTDGKSFSILFADLPTPLLSCKKPFKWSDVRRILFET